MVRFDDILQTAHSLIFTNNAEQPSNDFTWSSFCVVHEIFKNNLLLSWLLKISDFILTRIYKDHQIPLCQETWSDVKPKYIDNFTSTQIMREIFTSTQIMNRIFLSTQITSEIFTSYTQIMNRIFTSTQITSGIFLFIWEIWDFACLWQEDWMLGERLVRLWELRRRKYVFSSGIYNSTTALFAFHTYIISIFLPQLNQTPF